jgi:hypothetical protein
MASNKANLDWLPAARAMLNADPAFRRLGTADFKLGLIIGDEARLVSFEAFEVAEVAAADPADMAGAEIVLEMPVDDWNAYLRQRARGEGPSLLSLDLDGSRVRSGNPLERLALERYNRTVQALLDRGATLSQG